MRTCLSSFSDFFKDLTCVPHDTVKNVEETKPMAVMTEVKNADPPKEEPQNSLVENEVEVENLEVDSVYEKKVCKSKYPRATALESCLIITPLIIAVFYSYVLPTLIYNNS